MVTPNAHILRLRDAIHPEEVNTPVRRVCYIAQLVLSGDAAPADARMQLLRGIEQLSQVLTDPDSRQQLTMATAAVLEDQHYQALKALRVLLAKGGAASGRAPAMSFTPILVSTGYSGWAFLKRTLTSQQASLEKSPEIKRDEDYFRAKIGSITTPDQLVSDRRLLKVALTAFGLEADIDSKAFIKKILTDGTLNADALSNKLADKQYSKFSAAFGFGDFATPRTQLSTFPDEVLKAFASRQFETAVGEQDGDLRLALYAQRELPALADRKISEDTKWYTILGSTPLRTVVEAALGLPSSTASLDIDQQVTFFKDRAQKVFGSSDVSQFADPAKMETLVRRFLVKMQADQIQSQTGTAALAMLSQTSDMMRSWRF